MRRRELLRGVAALALLSAPTKGRALGRTPVGGRLTLSMPWPLGAIDPQDLFDPAAALFAAAIADPLFAVDATGEPYPTLLSEPPRVRNGSVVLRLRPGLASARGRPLDGRDLVFSMGRASRSGAGAALGGLPKPVLDPRDPLSVVMATDDTSLVARALSSPLLPLLPRTFVPDRPDGTGAMLAECAPGRLVLRRNPNAARGASFLDEIVVEQAGDLSESLRRFEAKKTDLGWLGAGLHTPRADAVPFDAGAMAFIVLRTGPAAGAWGAPGVAQQLVDAVPPGQVQHLGLGPLPNPTGEAAWGGPPCDLLFLQGAEQLGELAHILASLFTRPGHEITPRALAAGELTRRRSSGAYILLLDIVRHLGPAGPATALALASAADPWVASEWFRHPPRFSSFAARSITRTLPLGVVGELRVSGAHAPDVRLGRAAGTGAAGAASDEGWDLASTYRLGRPPA